MSASKQTGTAWETAIVRYLRERGFPGAERRALAGNKDLGDITGIVGLMVEAKAAKRHDLAGWSNEAAAQAINCKADMWAVWIKRPRHTSPAAGYVLLDGERFVSLLLDAGY